VLQLATGLHVEQGLHDLEVIAKDQHVVPAVAVSPECADRLKGYGHRVGEDFLLAFFGAVDQFVFAFAGWEEDAVPLRVKFLVGPEDFNQTVPLFGSHGSPQARSPPEGWGPLALT